MQSLIKSTAYQRGIPPSFKKLKQAASVFAQSAANVYFHICVKMLLSEIFGGRGDKVIHLISLFCLFSDLVSVSDVCVSGKKKQTVLRERLMPSDERVSVSGEGGVLKEEVDLWKVGRDGRRKRKRGVWESTESRGDDWVNPRGLSHPILGFTEQRRAEDQKGCERSHMLLASSPGLMIWKGGLGQIELI